MSYSQNYSATITVRGSKTVSYPKSDSGGSMTVNYADSEDVDIRIDVDTVPFDANVDLFRTELDELSSSVVILNAAQCTEIETSAERISTNIVDGFFQLIRSDISQQSVDLKNKFESQLMLLGQLAKQLLVYKKTMGEDYERIASRYHNIFAELNKECYRRIYAFNKPCFDIADDLRNNIVIDPLLHAAGEMFVYSKELQAAENAMAASRLRSRACQAVISLSEYIIQEELLKQDYRGVVFDIETTDRADLYFPCLCFEADPLESVGGKTFLPITPTDLGNRATSAVQASLQADRLSGGRSSPPAESEDMEELKHHFESLQESGGDKAEDQRVRDMIKKLWTEDLSGSTPNASRQERSQR